MELYINPVVAQEHIDGAIKFGVEFESTFAITAKKYIVDFFWKLLQSQKLKQVSCQNIEDRK